MNLKDRVKIINLDVETDHPPVGFISKLYFRFLGTHLEEEWAEVIFDKNLFNEENRMEGALHEYPEGVSKLSVETSRLEITP